MLGLIQKLFTSKSTIQKPTQLELQDIQGIVLSGYSHLSETSYIFVRVDEANAAKAWLAQLLTTQKITSALWNGKPKTAMNIALTYSGVMALGGSETLGKSFSPEFQQGIQHEERSRRIGDYQTINDPVHWDEYWQNNDVHFLLILQASAGEMDQTLAQQLAEMAEWGLSILEIERGYLPADHKEHFGFRDAISQPRVEGSPQSQRPHADDSPLTKAGEFILGYQNEDGNYPQTPFVPISEDVTNCLVALPDVKKRDFGRNGTYLVYRKMAQDVAGFRRYFQEQFETPEMGAMMAAKAVGRWPSGVSLVESPDGDPGLDSTMRARNDFNYRDRDPQGSRCPFAAHIRRLNPRDSLGDNGEDALKASQRRRILRRGTLYGEPLPEGQNESDQTPRGLHFFCLNSSIRRQFEFLQQSWVNNPKFHGLYEERDPLIGVNPDNSPRTMTVPDPEGAKSLSLPNFVAVKGGAYLFVPSLSALNYLTQC